MPAPPKTAIVTGASQGIGIGVVKAFADRGFNVVANFRNITQTKGVASDRIALVDGHIGDPATAAKIADTALARFHTIDALVNNAGIFFTKPFTDYTPDDIRSLLSTNLEGFLYLTQRAIKQMLAQKTGGSIVTITAALATNPIRGVTASVPMITKGGLETVTRHLAMEYAKDHIRLNAVAPGVVDTPMHEKDPKDVLQSLNPMGVVSSVQDVVDAVMYLTDAASVTGDTIYVDGGIISAAGESCLFRLGLYAAEGVEKVDTRVFELRTYTATPGKIDDLHARFRDHTLKLFEKHGMTVIAFWKPTDVEQAKRQLIYLLAFPSQAAAATSWKEFHADPEWKAVEKASEKNGKLFETIESVFLNPTDFSPLK